MLIGKKWPIGCPKGKIQDMSVSDVNRLKQPEEENHPADAT